MARGEPHHWRPGTPPSGSRTTPHSGGGATGEVSRVWVVRGVIGASKAIILLGGWVGLTSASTDGMVPVAA